MDSQDVSGGDLLLGVGVSNLLWTCMVLNSENLEEGAVGASGLSSAHPVKGSSLVDSYKTRPIVRWSIQLAMDLHGLEQ